MDQDLGADHDERKIDAEKCLLYWGTVGTACGICQVSCPWSRSPNLFHHVIREMAVRFPWFRSPSIKVDDLIYGYRPHSLLRWA